jgi:hypothetical protein
VARRWLPQKVRSPRPPRPKVALCVHSPSTEWPQSTACTHLVPAASDALRAQLAPVRHALRVARMNVSALGLLLSMLFSRFSVMEPRRIDVTGDLGPTVDGLRDTLASPSNRSAFST